MKNTIKTSAEVSDEAAAAIQSIRRLATALHQTYVATADLLDKLSDALETIRSTDNHPDISKLQRRVDRMNDLRRMAEPGSFMLEADRAMDRAWKQLP
jgi:hypothetical protein